jgi:hypothetical protein
MQRKKPGVDVIKDVLESSLSAFSNSTFIKSIAEQYEARGFLTKKQLQGLYQKASSIKEMAPGKLATLEAIILKMPTRYKSSLPENKPLYNKDEATGSKIHRILTKYPLHKRVLYFEAKYNNNEPLSAMERTELERFYKLVE